MANIDISPERRKLQQQYNGLKKLFSELTEKRDAMDQYEGPKLCSVYLELIGQLEYERLALQVEVKTLQMRRDLLQAFINRDEKPDLNAIEEKVKQAVAEYNRILAQEAERLQMAKEILNAPPLSEEESKEMRDLYRLLVKQLHPDLHPDQSDREAALFLQVQAAYKICDLYKLREIAPASQTANTRSVTFGSIFKFYLGLTNRLHKDNTIWGNFSFPKNYNKKRNSL